MEPSWTSKHAEAPQLLFDEASIRQLLSDHSILVCREPTSAGVLMRRMRAEVAETSFLGAILRRYVPGPSVDTPVAAVTSAGAVTWLHADGQGSIVNTSTSAGAAGAPSSAGSGTTAYTSSTNNVTVIIDNASGRVVAAY